MEKTADTSLEFGPPIFDDRAWRRKEESTSSENVSTSEHREGTEVNAEHIPAHRGFRDKYFQAFRKDSEHN